MGEVVWITLKLAVMTTLVLLVIGTPVAWWLSRSKSLIKDIVSAIVALPLVLPATVLGFYLLVAFNPQSPLGQFANALLGHPLPFSFEGLVVASVISSFPFAVHPIKNAFEAMGKRPMEVAATLGARPLDAFFTVALPQARAGLLSGAVLSFAHTIGEFGVVLMIGGNIPGETRVLSVAIYDHVENLEWAEAHILAGGMVAFAFLTILAISVADRLTRERRA